MTAIPREIDRSNPANALIISDERKAWTASETGKRIQALYRPTEVSLQFIRWLRVSLTRPTCYRQAIKHLRPLMLTYL